MHGTAAYRTARINIRSINGDPHRFHRRLQDHGIFIGASRCPQIWVHRFETYDFLETVCDSEVIKRCHRVNSVRIRENLQKKTFLPQLKKEKVCYGYLFTVVINQKIKILRFCAAWSIATCYATWRPVWSNHRAIFRARNCRDEIWKNKSQIIWKSEQTFEINWEKLLPVIIIGIDVIPQSLPKIWWNYNFENRT